MLVIFHRLWPSVFTGACFHYPSLHCLLLPTFAYFFSMVDRNGFSLLLTTFAYFFSECYLVGGRIFNNFQAAGRLGASGR